MIKNLGRTYSKYYNIANFNIEFKFGKIDQDRLAERGLRKSLEYYYRSFELEKPPKKIDYTIEFIQNCEYEIMFRADRKKHFVNFYIEEGKKIITFYHLSNLQFQIIVRRAIQKLLSENNGFLIHASSALVNNKAYLFLGKSGAGKSTAVKILTPPFFPLADDSAIIKEEKNKLYVYQTPVRDRYFLSYKRSKKYLLAGIFFLKKTPFYKIEKVKDKSLIAKNIIEQLFVEDEKMEKQIKNILKFVEKLDDFNYLYFSKDNPQKVVELIRNHEKV